jgi:hypothetical protein
MSNAVALLDVEPLRATVLQNLAGECPALEIPLLGVVG